MQKLTKEEYHTVLNMRKYGGNMFTSSNTPMSRHVSPAEDFPFYSGSRITGHALANLLCSGLIKKDETHFKYYRLTYKGWKAKLFESYSFKWKGTP